MPKVLRGKLFQFFIILIIAVVVVEFCVYLLIIREQNISPKHKYILDYERLLCGFKMPHKRKFEAPVKSCPTKGIITTYYHTEFSNLMWQYANVVAGALNTHLPPYVPFCVKDALRRLFDNIETPLLGDIGHCAFTLINSAASVEEWTDSSQSILISSVDLWPKIVFQYMNEVLQHFVFRKHVEDEARDFLIRLTGNAGNANNVTYVAVHIDKTREITDAYQDDEVPTVGFFVKAMEESRKQFANPRFVVVADNEAFWRSIFGHKRDVFLFSESSVGNNKSVLGILAHCNHSILSTDGLPVWAAILSRGSAIASQSLLQNYNDLIENYWNWSFLDPAVKS